MIIYSGLWKHFLQFIKHINSETHMKRPITTFLLSQSWLYFLLLSFSAWSQNSVIVGLPATGSNGSTEYPTPYGDSYEAMRAQYLYRADEIQQAGGPNGGLVFAVGFLVSNANGSGLLDNFSIRLSNTTANALSASAWEPAGTLVYDTSGWQAVDGANLHLLESPFLWDGASNLLVEICFTPTNPSAGNFESFNASVQWTEALPFNASRTFRDNNVSNVCGTSIPAQFGDPNTRPVLALRFSCVPPTQLNLYSLSSVSAGLQWTAPSGNPPMYQYEIGAPGFQPGSGNAILSGITADTSILFQNLAPQTNYDVWVRSDCGGDQFSPWIGPLSFGTAPGCGNTINDPGGAGNYSNNVQQTTTICVSAPTDVVTLHFTAFDLAPGDVLLVYNGQGITDPLIGEFTGNILPPPPTATTASGCLTLLFVSDTAQTGPGWSADITCNVPDSCFQVSGLNLFNLSATSANFSWAPVFGAVAYIWRLESPEGQVLAADTTNSTQLTLNNLTEGTNYRFFIKTDCGGSQTSDILVPFNTPLNCNNATVLGCNFGSSGPVSAVGTGIYLLDDCGDPTPGRERIFRFRAPNTRFYRLQVLSTTNSNVYVSYFYKPVSAGCGPDDWQCIGSFNTIEEITFGELTAGEEYYILFDPESTAAITQFFRIADCNPTNDEAWTAIDVLVDEICPGYIYANNNASYTSGEPDPDDDPSDGVAGRWLSEADATVWFSFQAPASGSVIVSTEFVNQGSNVDTQLALYEADDPFDYSTFRLLASDDDNGGVGLGFNSFFPYTGLTPGQTYYVQVDGFGFVEGTFCIEILEGITRIATADCDVLYSVAPIDGTQAGGDRWYNVFSMPDLLDLGDLVLAVKPGPQNLDTFFCKAVISDTIPITPFGVAYLPMYFQVSWSNAAATLPVEIRLFFLDDEFSALKSAANAPLATIEDLNVSYYNGVNQDCYLNNNDYPLSSSPVTIITNVAANDLSASPYFKLDLSIPGPGELGAHLGLIPLPMQLRSFTGRMLDHANRLEWVSEAERDMLWHIVERSQDGIQWLETGRVAGALAATTTLAYQLDDDKPLSQAYYRLRSIETDGEELISAAIFLNRGSAPGLINAYPSPATEQLQLTIQSDNANIARLLVYNVQGQAVLEQTLPLEKGLNNRSISVKTLPAGMYSLVLQSNNLQHFPIRFIKN